MIKEYFIIKKKIQNGINKRKEKIEIILSANRRILNINQGNIIDYPKTYNSQSISKFELMVKQVVESMFPQVGFRTVRPPYNMGAKGRALELDIYSHCFRLSIEAHGAQHYKYVGKYHNSIDDLYDQQDRDRMTRENMKAVKMTHIEVPYTCNTKEKIMELLLDTFEDMGGFDPVFYCHEGCEHDASCRED